MQANEVEESASPVPNNRCQFPNGTMDAKLIACDNPAARKIGGYWFCDCTLERLSVASGHYGVRGRHDGT
jgi:hypothetical protein